MPNIIVPKIDKKKQRAALSANREHLPTYGVIALESGVHPMTVSNVFNGHSTHPAVVETIKRMLIERLNTLPKDIREIWG